MSYLPGEPPRAGEDRPYTQPIKWIDWERHHGTNRPYENPLIEFVENRYRPTQFQLEQRWEGTKEYFDIPLIFADVCLEAERAKVQDSKRKLADLSFLDDPEYLIRENFYDVRRLQARIEEIEAILDSGIETRMERNGTPQTGYTWEEKQRPITSTTRVRYDAMLIELIKAKASLQGRATEIVEQRHSVTGSLEDMLDAAMKRNGHTDRDGYTITELEEAAKQLPAGNPLGASPDPLHPVPARDPQEYSRKPMVIVNGTLEEAADQINDIIEADYSADYAADYAADLAEGKAVEY